MSSEGLRYIYEHNLTFAYTVITLIFSFIKLKGDKSKNQFNKLLKLTAICYVTMKCNITHLNKQTRKFY
jgi:hypothetical protein